VKDDVVLRLIAALKDLRPDQVERVEAFVKVLQQPAVCTSRRSDFATELFAQEFGDVLRLHHHFSAEPFTKDKFEHAIMSVLNHAGHRAELARRGNPGHDITVGAERWSLKTQADQAIRRDVLHISKFMELGRGRWETAADLVGLRDQMFRHMESYDRIFSLRCFKNSPTEDVKVYEYELVEIPKALLMRAKDGKLSLVDTSTQTPKPGYCTIESEKGLLQFRLHFDGGTERKLQIKDLSKTLCTVHATWRVTLT
jgi:Type II site-specific deoxyribonuclease